MLVGFVPLVVWYSTDAVAPRPGWELALLNATVSGARLAWVASSRTRHLFEMGVWLFNYVFLGLAPLAQLRLGVDPLTTPALHHEYDAEALALVLLYQIALMVGSWGAGIRGSVVGRGVRDADPTRTLLVSTALLIAAGAFFFALGPQTVFSPRASRGADAVGSLGGDPVIATIVSGMVQFGLLVAIVAQLRVRTTWGKGGLFRRCVLSASVILLLAIVNPIGSARFTVGTVWLGLLAGVGLFASTTRYRWTVLAATLGFIFVFPILDSFRYSLGEVESFQGFLALTEPDYDGFGQLINSVQFVGENGVSWGLQLLGVLVFWVPRSWWPNKPVDTGVLLADYRGYGFTNLSAPMPAELFVNFGVPGLIVGSLAIGALLRAADAGSDRSLAQNGLPTVLGCVLPFYMVFLFRGSLLQATSNLAVMILVWILASRGPRKH